MVFKTGVCIIKKVLHNWTKEEKVKISIKRKKIIIIYPYENLFGKLKTINLAATRNKNAYLVNNYLVSIFMRCWG